MKRRDVLMSLGVAMFAARGARANEPVIGVCEGCDFVFVDMPKQLSSHARIAPESERGKPLTLTGLVTIEDGRPAAGVVVYAYHTDDTGIYPPASTRHGRLRGWARTDAKGEYRFDTIRPAAYPGNTIPQHIHMHVIEPGRGTYYIDDVHFEDDPLWRKSLASSAPRGGPGLVKPRQSADGRWHVKRDIRLGVNVPNYPSS